MSLAHAARSAQVIETLENYAVNDDTTVEKMDVAGDSCFIYSDEQFWKSFIGAPDKYWDAKTELYGGTITNWVARTPGLYWGKNSERLRKPPESEVQFRSGAWTTYHPMGKSSIVMGGIGDFVLPPDDEGKVIMTVSCSNNASTGIPVLFHPEVIRHHKLKQGDTVHIHSSYWTKMSAEWSNKFHHSAEIKRGYLIVDNPDHIRIEARNQPVEFHPCTVMEYNSGDALLYDFVFCTADTAFDNYRTRIVNFFENYKTEHQRYGKYLIPADATDPLFESRYDNPADLLRTEPDGRSQLKLVTERIQNTFYHRGETIESLMINIPHYYPTSKDILALAIRAGIPQQEIQISAAAKMSTQLVEISINRKTLEVLVDCIIHDHPAIINR